ncbi:hypothetical protein DFH06DRAFT_1146236 [Mycena polygramma]|nr:hypothetical protein DFH06DRAFT_1146236 [Mycena polygramma]
MLPTAISSLAAPPAAFVPCLIPTYLGANFKDHASFSRILNKNYWVLFTSDKQGAYSLKSACLAAKGSKISEEEEVGCLETWEEVLRAWAMHCYHRHGKCRRHPGGCLFGQCSGHGGPAGSKIVVVRIKREGGVKIEEPEIKREGGLKIEEPQAAEVPSPAPVRTASSPARRRGVMPRTAPPSYTPIPETESDVDSDGMPRDGAPLYDPDTPDSASAADAQRGVGASEASPTPASRVRSPSYVAADAPASARVRSPSYIAEDAPGPATKRRATTVASLSRSAASSTGSSVSRARKTRGPVSANASTVTVHDAFYVDATGAIHHSRADAFKQVGAGPVKVVLGWDAATEYAQRLLEENEPEEELVEVAPRGKGKGKALSTMDLDA